jgi:hypothetical protein
MVPRVLGGMVEGWGPKWTDANFSGLVELSASGWEPYKYLLAFLGRSASEFSRDRQRPPRINR